MNFPDIGKLTERISKVRLRGGVVGKVSTVLITVSISMAIISWSAGSIWIAGAAIVFLFTLSLIGILQMISFAKENPQAALFEGSELLVHESMKMGMKNFPTLPDEEQEPSLPPTEIEDVEFTIDPKEPDSLPVEKKEETK